ncbi:MAG: hypothetical protein MZV49_12205 [Rhodopseudomonas palustris]|nr:hypothetical protein [Rhodopseudomonas palustris]
MTKALPFTSAALTRAIRGVEAAGRHVVGVRVADGTLIIGEKPVGRGFAGTHAAARCRGRHLGGQGRMSALETNLPYLSSEEDRHGTDRLYVRRADRRIRIRAQIGTPEFAREYADAVEALGARCAKTVAAGLKTHQKGTLGWLGTLYFQVEGDFLSLAKDSQRARRNDLEACFALPLEDKAPQPVMETAR